MSFKFAIILKYTNFGNIQNMKIENLFHMVSNCGDLFVRKQGIYDRIFLSEHFTTRQKFSKQKKLSMQHREHNPQLGHHWQIHVTHLHQCTIHWKPLMCRVMPEEWGCSWSKYLPKAKQRGCFFLLVRPTLKVLLDEKTSVERVSKSCSNINWVSLRYQPLNTCEYHI